MNYGWSSYRGTVEVTYSKFGFCHGILQQRNNRPKRKPQTKQKPSACGRASGRSRRGCMPKSTGQAASVAEEAAWLPDLELGFLRKNAAMVMVSALARLMRQ